MHWCMKIMTARNDYTYCVSHIWNYADASLTAYLWCSKNATILYNVQWLYSNIPTSQTHPRTRAEQKLFFFFASSVIIITRTLFRPRQIIILLLKRIPSTECECDAQNKNKREKKKEKKITKKSLLREIDKCELCASWTMDGNVPLPLFHHSSNDSRLLL